MGQVILVELGEHLFHLLLFLFGTAIHIDGAVHEILEGQEGFVFLRAHLHIPLAAAQDAVDHGGDALRLRLTQHGGAISGQGGRVQHTGTHGILDIVVHKGDLIRHADDASLRGGRPGALGMGHDAVAHLPGQVQAPAVFFQLVHHTQALHIMPEPLRAELVQCALPCVAKGRVPQVMGQTDGLGQILVEAQGAGNGAGDLRHLQCMGEPGAVEVALR